jgi:single-strand DNA-binding protein
LSAAIAEDPGYEHCNEVHLVGKVAAQPEEVELPSGDVLVKWRLVIDRPQAEQRSNRRAVDVLHCSARKAGIRRSVKTWDPGDIVEIDGVLRRRFFSGDGGGRSLYEVEARSVRRLSRS